MPVFKLVGAAVAAGMTGVEVGAKGGGAMADPLPDGPARELGRGWKCRPSINIAPGQIADLADIVGPGMIQSMWLTGSVARDVILRILHNGGNQSFVIKFQQFI